LADKLTCTPPAGAVAVSVTVPVAPWPPVTAAGEIDKLAITPDWPAGLGFTVSVAETELAAEAVMVTGVEAVTGEVDTWNVAVVCPARTVTDEGMVAAEPLADRLTCTPPGGAADASVTAPAALCCPPITAEGEIDRAEMVGWPPGKSVAVADRLCEPRAVVIVTDTLC